MDSETFEALVEQAHEYLGMANMMGEIQLADRWGFPIEEDMEREICRIVLNSPGVRHVLDSYT